MFLNILNELFGEENVTKYATGNPADWLVLMNDFEGKKQGFRILKNKTTNIRVPASFSTLTKKIKKSALKRHGENEITLRTNEYICLSSKVMKGLFKPVMDCIKEHLTTVLGRPKLSKVKTMLLVGGFSDSPLLQEELRNKFSKRYRVLAPRDAVTAVLKGAVLFGKNPAKITERVVGATYGVRCAKPFDKRSHPEENRFLADGLEMCKNIFSRLIKENETVSLGENVTGVYFPIYANATLLTIAFYVADDPDVRFVTDQGVTEIGSVNVQSPDTSLGRKRVIEVTLHFGGTEIVSTAVDKASGKKVQTTLDFFHK